jgi:predicted nucleotidyltransferase
MNIKAVANEFKTEMIKLYGEKLYKVVLFGSFARNDFREDSDVDFLVVLNKDDVRPLTEITKISPVLGEFLSNYHKVFSVVPTSRSKYEISQMPLYMNIRSEGIEI